MAKAQTIRFNDRNYQPGEYEVWEQSYPVAHSKNLAALQAKYPRAKVVSK